MTDGRTWMGGGGGIPYAKGYRRQSEAEIRREIHGPKPKPVEVAEPVPDVVEPAEPVATVPQARPKAPPEPDYSRREAFALHYAVDPEENGARAARCAGYRPSNARNTASRLLAEDDHVQFEITEWRNRMVQIEQARRAVDRDKYGGRL